VPYIDTTLIRYLYRENEPIQYLHSKVILSSGSEVISPGEGDEMANLSVTRDLFFVFALFLIIYNDISYTQIKGKMSPVKYRPFDAGLLYNITTANEDSCSSVCIQHPACVISLYSHADSSCCGYSTKHTTNIELDEDVKAWQITYQGMWLVFV